MTIGTQVPLRAAAKLVVVPTEVDVVDNIEIQVAVVVDIGPRRRGAPSLVAHSSLSGDVAEGSITVVAIQSIGSEVGDVQIGKAVVVIVGSCGPHSVAKISQAGGPGSREKGAVPEVAIEDVV